MLQTRVDSGLDGVVVADTVMSEVDGEAGRLIVRGHALEELVATRGYEATAVNDAVRNPLKALAAQLKGPRTEGEMAPEIPLDRQRPAEYVFSRHVEEAMARLNRGSDRSKREPQRAGGAG